MNNDDDRAAPDRVPASEVTSGQRYTFDILGRRVPAAEPDTEPSRCYMLGTSRVHVRPGCRCKRRTR